MRPSYASLCSVSNFFFWETWQTFLQCFSHHHLAKGFDCWQFVVNASHISQSYFALWGQRIFYWVWLCGQSLLFSSRAAALVSRLSRPRAQRWRARALPLLNLKKKRDCSQSMKRCMSNLDAVVLRPFLWTTVINEHKENNKQRGHSFEKFIWKPKCFHTQMKFALQFQRNVSVTQLNF